MLKAVHIRERFYSLLDQEYGSLEPKAALKQPGFVDDILTGTTCFLPRLIFSSQN